MKPHVLAIQPVLPFPPDDGGKIRYANLFRYLASDFRLTLLAFSTPESERKYEPGTWYTEGEIAFKTVRRQRMPLWRKALNPWRGMPHRTSYHLDRNMARAVQATSRDDPPALVHVTQLYMAQYRTCLARPVAAIITLDDIETVKFERYLAHTQMNPLARLRAEIQRRRLRTLQNSLVAQCDACIAVSEHDKQVLQSLNLNMSLFVVPNGVDTNYFRPAGQAETSRELVFTGFMLYEPNEDAMLYFVGEILPRIWRVHPETTLTIVGKLPSPAIVALAADLRITVTGYVEDTRPYVAEAAVYVVPLRIGSGTRIKILEAMAMGKTVVTTSVGCEGLQVEDGHDILVADPPGDFAQRVIWAMDHPQERKRIGWNARQTVESQFDWKMIARRQARIFREFLGENETDKSWPGRQG